MAVRLDRVQVARDPWFDPASRTGVYVVQVSLHGTCGAGAARGLGEAEVTSPNETLANLDGALERGALSALRSAAEELRSALAERCAVAAWPEASDSPQ